MSKKITILGAGLAGLTAGVELARAGKEVLVLEKNTHVGGLASTFQIGDYRFDTGPHRWYSKIQEVDLWVRQLMGDEFINVSRLTRIYFNKKYYYYPMKPLNALAGIGIFKAIRALIDYFLTRLNARINPQPTITMEDAYIKQFGKTLYEIFFKNYSKKLWGRSCDQLSGDWVAQRSRGMSIYTIIRDAFFPSKGKVVSLVEEFSYPKLGIGRISEKLAEEIKVKGGKIILGAEIVGLRVEMNKITNITIKRNDNIEEIEAEEVITSIPITSLIKYLRPAPLKEITDAAHKLSFRNIIFVAVFLNKGKITPDQWIYTQDPSLPFVRILETDNWSKYLSPPGSTSLVFEITCDEKDNIWEMQDRKVVAWALDKYVKEFGTLKKEDIIGNFVHRQENEYPIYQVNYQEPLKIVKDHLKKIVNLQSIGRSGMYRYNNMDHSIETGLYAARNIISGGKKYDIESINIEREYLEEKKL